MKRPNILFALADDASHFSPYGYDYMNTPAIDSVAEYGVVFENAFTCNPKCAPSRATLLTGRYTWELEDACNHFSRFPNKFALLPDLLGEIGYHTGYTGMGWKPGDWQSSGLKRNPAGTEYNSILLTPPENTGIFNVDYAANFEYFLNERAEGQPFFFWYGASEPHRPYSFGEGLRAGKSISDIKKSDIPSYWPDCDEVRVDMLDYAYEIEWFDMHLGRMLDKLRSIGELDNTIVIVTSDNGCPFPRVKGQMYEQDFHIPMVAQWTAGQGGGGRRVRDLVSLVDFAPTVLEAAGTTIPEEMTGRSMLDILTGEAEDGSEERRYTYFGREKHDPGREGDLGYPVRCVRDERYLYIKNYAPARWPAGNPETSFPNCDYSPTKRKIIDLYEHGEPRYYELAFGKHPGEELYDIVEDPECLNNLVASPEFQILREKMADLLESFLRKTGDPRVLGDEDYFDRIPSTVDGKFFTWKALEEGRFSIAPWCRYDWNFMSSLNKGGAEKKIDHGI